jgi:hypothetical protein
LSSAKDAAHETVYARRLPAEARAAIERCDYAGFVPGIHRVDERFYGPSGPR